MPDPWANLPGGDLVTRGLQDLSSGLSSSVPALTVLQATTTLRHLGVPVPEVALVGDPGILLYQAVASEKSGGYHSRYLALLENLESFLRARERELSRVARRPRSEAS